MGPATFLTKSELRAHLPFGKALYREQALAVFRFAASLAFVFILPLISRFAGIYQPHIRLVLFGYAFASLLILARVFLVPPFGASFVVLVRACDLIGPSLICLFTGCADSPFLLLFIFAILAAPYRRKAIETLLITFSSILIVLCESAFATLPAVSSHHLFAAHFALGPFAVRTAILLITGGFLAYTAHWAEREQQAFATRSILRRLHADAGVQTNLREILPSVLNVFEAKRIVLVLRNSSTGRVFQWSAWEDRSTIPIYRDVPASQEDRYFWSMPAGGWSVAISKGRKRCSAVALDREGARIRNTGNANRVHAEDVWTQPFENLLVTTVQFRNEWTGRLFLVDAPCAAGRESCLRLLQQMAVEVGPIVYNFYCWKHTRARIRSAERQRIARDLHDTVVQSLIATELQLDLLRRKNEFHLQEPADSEVLLQTQDLLRREVYRVRSQIEQLRSSTTPRKVLAALPDMLRDFERDTGITTHLVCNVQESSIPRRISSDVVRILEEALSNVRRHSGARAVEVRLTSHRDLWEIVIQDDGRGFDFAGRLSMAEMDAAGKGPRVIRERVHSVNGDLTLESYPDRGARLAIRFASAP